MSHFNIVKLLIHKSFWQFIWLACLVLPNIAYGAPTDLDLSFGTGGKVLTAVGNHSVIHSVALQPDNKMIAVGQGMSATGQTVIAVLRYLPDGKLDTSFGSAKNGIVTATVKTGTLASDVAIESDGKIVIVAQELANTGEFIVARLLNNGDFDTSFAGTGKVLTPMAPIGKPAYANALLIQSDGKIVVAGSSESSSTNLDITVVRYNQDGSLDMGFGRGGKVVTSLSAGRDEAQDVMMQSDGKIVVGGRSFNGKYDDFALVRYNSNGTLDNTFGINGVVILPADSQGGVIHAMALQADGRIVAAGMSHNGVNQNFAAVRLLQNGSLDNSFAGTGKVTLSFGAVDSAAHSVAIQSNGTILLSGYGDKSPGMSLFALARLLPNGTPDAFFGSNGKILTEISPPNLESAAQVIVQNGGRILVAGSSSRTSTESQFALVRYMGDPVAPPSSPEIEVQENQVVIANNGSINFGITSQGTDITKTFLVKNQGNAPLTLISPIQIKNSATTPNAFSSTGTFTLVSDMGNASTVSASSLMLASGSIASFTVKLSGQTVGTHSGSVTFSNNDSDEMPYSFAIAGQVTTDKISQLELWDGATLMSNTVTQIDFGSTMQGQPLSRIFVVKNTGNADLVLSNWIFPTGFRANGSLPTTITSGASIAFDIQLDGITAGLYTGKLQFNSNDSGKNPFIFEIKGFIGARGQTMPLGISQLEVSEGGIYLQDNLSRIDFGKITKGFPSIREIMLHNAGSTQLHVNTLVLPTGFQLRGTFPTTIEPNSKVPFQLELNTKESGNYSGVLTFKSSDPKRSTVTLYLSGITEEFVATSMPSTLPPPPNGMIDNNHFNDGSTMTDVKILPTGSITGGNLSGDIKNQGLIANVNIAPDATIDGGKVSGFNTNQGTMCNLEVSNHSRIEGGVYCGQVLNQGTLTDPKIEKNAVIHGDGMLSGTVQNSGMVCGMHLDAGAQVVGGQLSCDIKGKVEAPAIIGQAQIQADTKLENVCLTRSVVMSSNVTVGSNVTVNNNSSSEAVMQDYCISPQQVPAFDDKRIKGTEKDAFQTFDAPNVAVLPEQAAAGFSSEQMGEFKKDALMGFKPEQFKQMPLEALSGLTRENVGGFQAKVLREMTVETFSAMPPVALQETEDFAKIATNVDLVKLKPQNFKPVLPQNWQMDETTGKLHPPPGSKISFKAMDAPSLSSQIEMPMDMPDFSSSLAVGGRPIAGETVVEKLNQTLNSQGFKEYSLRQNSTGVVMVEGSSTSKDISLALLPDSDNMQQMDTTEAAGVSVDKTGRYMVTTEDGWQIPMIPAPQDVSDLVNVLGTDSVVKVGKKGDVLMSYTSTQRRGARANEEVYVYFVVIFDPFIDPSLQDFCDASGCNWDSMNLQPGVNFDDNGRAKQQITVVYSQGKVQKAYPTVLAPDTFIKEAKKFAGVEDIVYNTDGSFTLTYQGQTLYLYPTTQVIAKKLEQYETVKPSLVQRDDGMLEYSVQTGELLLTSVVSISE